VSVKTLGRQLGFEVATSKRNLARLTDARNAITIFGDPHGAVYLNGTKIDTSGRIEPMGDTLYLAPGIVSDIEAALQRGRRTPPPPAPAPRRESCGTVVMDAGHGGKDPGAVAAGGLREKDVNLPVTLDIAERLRTAGVKVVLTRRSDRFVELDDRVAITNQTRPDLFVSIHADSSASRLTRGYTVFYPRRHGPGSASHRAGLCIQRRLDRVDPRGRGLKHHPTVNLRVLEKTRYPALLVELGFLSNRDEAALLESISYQSRLAGAISEGILEYLENK
jgi:N-acetylmuramoyl-L-alanine amidase